MTSTLPPPEPSTRARWERPAHLGLLLSTAVLYVWNLSASGWANSFYSAAVQAGSVSWKAFFFGSSDAANSITVDKPPASLWPMELSVRIFGLNSWAILIPEALMGVATVAIVYASVRRYFSAQAALFAGAALALTPVAALMFKFNNPDAMLALLLTAATALTVKAIGTGKARWLVWAGVAIGFGFLTKQLQAFLVLPALIVVYAYAAPHPFLVRVRHLLYAFGAMIVAGGWWVAIVELVPASDRPYIGGSQTNDFLNLTFGYNGLGRITGSETGSVTPGGGGAGRGMWGVTGLWRLFENEIGGQIAWLLPAALALTLVALWVTRAAPRTDARRALVLAYSVSMLTTAIAFSFMAGIFHAYYTVALAPGIAVAVAVGGELLWERREAWWARIVAAAVVLGSAWWAWILLDRASGWNPWVKVLAVVLAVVASALIVLGSKVRIATAGAVLVAMAAVLVAPTAYSLETVGVGHSGSIVTAGPTVASGMGGPGGGGGMRGGRGFAGGTPPAGRMMAAGHMPPMPTGGQMPAFPGGQVGTQAGATRGGFGVGGGLLNSSSVSAELRTLLEQNGTTYTWVAAAVGSNEASGYQLATQFPVMPIGGFNGSDPSPTLAQFQAYVAAKKIHYFLGGHGIAGGMGIGRSNGGSNVSSQISTWVEAHFTAKTVGGVTLYDLTTPKA
ncbi:glycosyl transferase [Nocardioides baekrokdamisoli]|uniref:Glycosyl transferase n=1 Tax=Nocardioides baekrokdamisoli TaxID=1804624 RepID=A0A3G9IH91_9ACTN|nr:glycosyltransferase family 39 protein [Nocardioides baekrokdamisoli]BBH17572.1 glycosyl transferase [Nocardioides baekrokdamisoli]